MSYRKGEKDFGEMKKRVTMTKASRCICPRVPAEADANKLKNENVWQVV
jgi:hypothetical protein